MALYEINRDVLNIDPETGEVIEIVGGLSGVIESDSNGNVLDMGHTLKEQREELMLNLVKRIKNLDDDVDSYKREMAKMKDSMNAKRTSLESTKNYLKGFMKANDVKKFEEGIFGATRRKATAKVNLIDEDSIPSFYKEDVTTIKIDKKAIKEDLKDGKIVDGAELQWSEGLLIK